VLEDAKPEQQKRVASLFAKHLPSLFPLNVNFAVSTFSLDLSLALRAYRTTSAKLHNAVHFVCQPAGGDPCGKGASVAWLGPSSNFFICADWKTKPPDDQVVSMLAGLYGYLGGLDNLAWRTGLARIAFEITQTTFRPPSHAEVVGSPSWSKDQIKIDYVPEIPKNPTKYEYEESGSKHERLSNDVPTYEGTLCQASRLPFKFDASFWVDSIGAERPGPYPAPRVAMEYGLEVPGGVRKSQNDPATVPQGAGFSLQTKLKLPVEVILERNGPFHIKLTLEDPETGVVRVYEDVIQVLAVQPCDAPLKDPRQTPTPGAPGGVPGRQNRESGLA
jgi:hypothetical protein